MVERFAIANRLTSRAAQPTTPGSQPAGFVDQTIVEHTLDTAVDSRVKLLLGPLQDEHPTGFGRSALVEFHLLMTNRLTGNSVNLERPNQPPRVVGMQLRGRERVDLSESIVERLLAYPLQLFLDLRAKFPIGLWTVEQAPQERFEVQRRAAHKEHLAPS